MVLTLAALCAPWPELSIVGDPDLEVRTVVADSRQAGPGAVFVAVRGLGADGHDHVADAVAAGAAAVVVERARLAELRAALPASTPVAWVAASCTRGLPARLARECEGRPDQELLLVGVTGTNGKTTTTFLLQAMLGRVHGRCGLLGTIRYDDGRQSEPSPLTTPGGPLLYRWLSRMRGNGCAAAALEISSHALQQDRTGDLALDAAVMMNIGRDHLDYHGDQSAYLAAKTRILDLLAEGPRRGKGPGVAVINAADRALAAVGTPGQRTMRFAAAGRPGEVAADLVVKKAELSLQGIALDLDWRGRPLRLASPLVGRFNVENLTAALATALALGLDAAACCGALSEVQQVPGRLERFVLPAGGLAVVDYAHTPDALAAVLASCRELGGRRLIVVFGCGGDRDRGKRPLMGRVAAELADAVWITTDNPRSEVPGAICEEIYAGYAEASGRRAGRCEIVLERRTAIEAALTAAGAGDVVVVAGKGHEDYQLVGGKILPLDDRQIIRHWIACEQSHA